MKSSYPDEFRRIQRQLDFHEFRGVRCLAEKRDFKKKNLKNGK